MTVHLLGGHRHEDAGRVLADGTVGPGCGPGQNSRDVTEIPARDAGWRWMNRGAGSPPPGRCARATCACTPQSRTRSPGPPPGPAPAAQAGKQPGRCRRASSADDFVLRDQPPPPSRVDDQSSSTTRIITRQAMLAHSSVPNRNHSMLGPSRRILGRTKPGAGVHDRYHGIRRTRADGGDLTGSWRGSSCLRVAPGPVIVTTVAGVRRKGWQG